MIKRYDIITIGSALNDIFVDTGLKELKTKNKKFAAYPAGYKIAIRNIKFSIGGGGINTAVGFSRMGLKTAYLGKIGNDDSAKKIINILKKEKIDFIGKQENSITGHSIILDSYEHERTILTYKGPSE
jgi:ribokinase